MPTALKILYGGAALLAVIALVLGSVDYFAASTDERSLLVDIVLPLGMLIVVALLYRRRKSELESR